MMNGYKEIISGIQGDAAFRHIISECGADGKVWFDKRFICDYVSHLKYNIEKLVKERDEEMNELKIDYTEKIWTVELTMFAKDKNVITKEDLVSYLEMGDAFNKFSHINVITEQTFYHEKEK